MNIAITNKEILTIRRLGNALRSQIVPVKDIAQLLDGFQQKLDKASAGTAGPVKRTSRKEDRKNKYKLKIAL